MRLSICGRASMTRGCARQRGSSLLVSQTSEAETMARWGRLRPEERRTHGTRLLPRRVHPSKAGRGLLRSSLSHVRGSLCRDTTFEALTP